MPRTFRHFGPVCDVSEKGLSQKGSLNFMHSEDSYLSAIFQPAENLTAFFIQIQSLEQKIPGLLALNLLLLLFQSK